jgi:amino acid transporter
MNAFVAVETNSGGTSAGGFLILVLLGLLVVVLIRSFAKKQVNLRWFWVASTVTLVLGAILLVVTAIMLTPPARPIWIFSIVEYSIVMALFIGWAVGYARSNLRRN